MGSRGVRSLPRRGTLAPAGGARPAPAGPRQLERATRRGPALRRPCSLSPFAGIPAADGRERERDAPPSPGFSLRRPLARSPGAPPASSLSSRSNCWGSKKYLASGRVDPESSFGRTPGCGQGRPDSFFYWLAPSPGILQTNNGAQMVVAGGAPGERRGVGGVRDFSAARGMRSRSSRSAGSMPAKSLSEPGRLRGGPSAGRAQPA